MKAPTFLALLLLAACGTSSPAPPASPPPGASAAPVASSSAPPVDEPARPRKPIEVHNSCGDVVTVVFAEDPKAPNAPSKTIASSSSVEGLRDADGNVTIWLLDAKGEPLIKVHVTRGMKKVEVGRSCRTLDAR